MNKPPVFSVILPCYNAEKTLHRTLKSVFNQSFKSFEVILINDGSTDDSLKQAYFFAEKYKHMRIITQDNQGVSVARNTGIKHAKGRYLAFLDADDEWAVHKLAKHAQQFVKYSKLGMSYARVHIHDPHLKKHRILSKYIKKLNLYHVMGDNFVCTSSNIVVRKTALEEIGLFNSGLNHAEDQEWLARAVCQRKWLIRGLPHILVHYHTSYDGLSSDLSSMETSWLRLAETLKYKIPDFELKYYHKSKALFYRYLARRALRMGYKYCVCAHYFMIALKSSLSILWLQPKRTCLTGLGIGLAFLRDVSKKRTL